MVHQNLEQRSFFRNAGSEYDVADLPQANDAAGKKETLESGACSRSVAKAKNFQFASKLSATEREIEKLLLLPNQKETHNNNFNQHNSSVADAGRGSRGRGYTATENK